MTIEHIENEDGVKASILIWDQEIGEKKNLVLSFPRTETSAVRDLHCVSSLNKV